jgi:hypothetical protein
MKIINNYNNLYIIPTLCLYYEKDYYLYIELMWLKYGISIKIFDKL